MNPKVKVRMPKWQNLKSKNWAKELLMTFIGTTLSILLTFGTANYLEERQKRADGRQTAMMVIHDMENTSELFSEMEKEEEKYFNCAMYVLEHRNEIDSIPADTLQAFARYVAAPATEIYNYDTSSETLFLSSQDVWKNINNASFIDAVQEFFSHRQVVFKMLNNDGVFARPVSHEDYYAMLLSGKDVQENARNIGKNFAKKYINSNRVQAFIHYSVGRRRHFSQYAEAYRLMANRCKFMMDISDADIRAYVASHKRAGHPVKEKDVVGVWEIESSSNYKAEREYQKDHTFAYTVTNYHSHPNYTGQIEYSYKWQGAWELKGDTLIHVLYPECEFHIDDSKISYSKDEEAQIKQMLSSWEESLAVSRHANEDAGEQRMATIVSIDAAKEKIEVQTIPKEKEGEREVVYYMERKGER